MPLAAACGAKVPDVSHRRRFEAVMQPSAENFNPLPAAAYLLDPSLSAVLLEPEQAALLHATKTYVIQECTSGASAPTEGDQTATSPALSRFRFLASMMKSLERAAASAVNSTDGAVTQLARYVTDAAEAGALMPLTFGPVGKPPTALCYHSRRTYLIAAPASQA